MQHAFEWGKYTSEGLFPHMQHAFKQGKYTSVYKVLLSTPRFMRGRKWRKLEVWLHAERVLFAVRRGVSFCPRKYLPVVIFCSETSGYCRYLIHAQPNLLASHFTFDVKISWRAIVVKWSRGRGSRSLLMSSMTIYLHQTNTAMFWAAEFAKEAPAILQEKFGCG